MTTQSLTTTTFLLILSLITSAVTGQCVDYGIKSISSKHQANAVRIAVKNNCPEEVYFTVLAKKEDGKVHQLLKGQLKVGESINHLGFGPFTTELVGQHVVIDENGYWEARKSIDMYIQEAKQSNILRSPVDTKNALNSADIVLNEE